VGKFIHDAGRKFQISQTRAQKYVHRNVKLHVTKPRYSKTTNFRVGKATLQLCFWCSDIYSAIKNLICLFKSSSTFIIHSFLQGMGSTFYGVKPLRDILEIPEQTDHIKQDNLLKG
jgi:hypothetical protein